MKKIFTILILCFSITTIHAQHFDYKNLDLSEINYQTGMQTSSSVPTQGFFNINLPQSIATFSFFNIITNQQVEEQMTIVNSNVTPSSVSFIAITRQFGRYDVFIDYSTAKAQFVKTSWLADKKEQANTYPHIWVYTFHLTNISSDPQGTFETPQVIKGKNNSVGNKYQK